MRTLFVYRLATALTTVNKNNAMKAVQQSMILVTASKISIHQIILKAIYKPVCEALFDWKVVS